jgi:hypothetical protein
LNQDARASDPQYLALPLMENCSKCATHSEWQEIDAAMSSDMTVRFGNSRLRLHFAGSFFWNCSADVAGLVEVC